MQRLRILLRTVALLGALGFLHLENRAHAAVSLGEALNAPGLLWSTVGSPAWEGQTILSHDGVDAAASGAIADSAAVTIQTTVTGPGTISFWWKVSSELTNDYLKFFISGYQQMKISGEVDWQLQTFNVPAGSQVLKWTYSKNASNSAGLDCGWVDQVQFAVASNCTFSVSPVTRSHGSGAATGTVSIATLAGCPWTVSNSNTWVHIPTGLISLGNGTVIYDVAANESPMARQATLNIAGQWVVISQDGVPASDPNLVSLAEALDTAGANLVWLTTGALPWTGQTAISHDGVDAAQSGAVSDSSSGSIQTVLTGPGTLSFWWKVSSEANSDRLRFFVNGSESANISGEVGWLQRNIALSTGLQILEWKYTKNSALAAGQDRGWVDQVQFTPTVCTFAISPPTRTHGYGAATNLVTVAAAADYCAWTVVNSNSWLTFSGAVSGSGNGTIPYSIAANPTTQARTGVVSIAGQIFTISQLGVSCTYSLSPTNRDHGPGATSGALNVNTALACSWNASTTNSWITILPGTNNVGAGIVNYALSANPDAPRTGVILVVGQSFTIHQSGGQPLGVSPSVTLVRQPNGDVTLSFSGILQSGATVNGTFVDVPGTPQGSYTIPKGSLELKRFYRTRTP
jgi:hypothetical protein